MNIVLLPLLKAPHSSTPRGTGITDHVVSAGVGDDNFYYQLLNFITKKNLFFAVRLHDH